MSFKGLIDARKELRQAACAGAGMAFCARIRSTTGDEGERMENEESVRKYLRLLESNCIDEAAYTELLHPEVEQTEFPNLLNKQGQASGWADLFRRMAIGRTILANQSFEITGFVENGSRAVVEAKWRGTMAISAGQLAAGQELKAFFCMVFEFRDGKIHKQRNDDCFETF